MTYPSLEKNCVYDLSTIIKQAFCPRRRSPMGREPDFVGSASLVRSIGATTKIGGASNGRESKIASAVGSCEPVEECIYSLNDTPV